MVFRSFANVLDLKDLFGLILMGQTAALLQTVLLERDPSPVAVVTDSLVQQVKQFSRLLLLLSRGEGQLGYISALRWWRRAGTCSAGTTWTGSHRTQTQNPESSVWQTEKNLWYHQNRVRRYLPLTGGALLKQVAPLFLFFLYLLFELKDSQLWDFLDFESRSGPVLDLVLVLVRLCLDAAASVMIDGAILVPVTRYIKPSQNLKIQEGFPGRSLYASEEKKLTPPHPPDSSHFNHFRARDRCSRAWWASNMWNFQTCCQMRGGGT